MGWEEWGEFHRAPYSRLVDLQIGALNYEITGVPFLSMTEMIRIVEGMKPVRIKGGEMRLSVSHVSIHLEGSYSSIKPKS